LGLNDYLATALPNIHQITNSNMVEVKKNDTIKWYNELPAHERQQISDLPIKKQEEV